MIFVSNRHAERGGGQKGSSPGGPETQRGPGFRIVKIECKTTAYGRLGGAIVLCTPPF